VGDHGRRIAPAQTEVRQTKLSRRMTQLR